jgi:non-canonical purine NTP pyrophosphatase (RdgB/HAM1 family)/dephospho-CoA kinase
MELVLATRNEDKIREIKEALRDSSIRILTFKDFPKFPLLVEDKDTLNGNAKVKARGVAKFTHKIALADDTGLEVEALGRAPGVLSSRFAGEGASYKDNNKKLLSLLKKVPLRKRRATFRCVMVISDGARRETTVEGTCQGRIVRRRRGRAGFGYDPLFQPQGYERTFAELSLKEKNLISHRGKALEKVKKILELWLKSKVIGLTGNIGCGKTTVAREFEDLGVKVIEADRIGHQLLEKEKIKKRVVNIFTESVLNGKGNISRKKLRNLVFKDKKKLKLLNSILHPLMVKEIKKKIRMSQSNLIIVDAAVLLEAGWDSLVDKILVVTTSYHTQLKRIKDQSDFSPVEIKGIMEAQFPQSEKIKRADFVIENEGSIDKTRQQVRKLWEKLNEGGFG